MELLDFGRYLSQQRELRGLSRGDVVAVTKIPESTIAALEAGETERLPSRTYVLKFIRAYAQVIGLEPEETVLRYEELDPSPATLAFNAAALPPAPPHNGGEAVQPQPPAPRKLLWGGAAVATAVAGAGLIAWLR